MYSGISGLRNFQTKLDVIGNNIANVNTHGFKKGRTTFKDMVSQQIAGASSPGQNMGGTNPRQVGLGAMLASIDTIGTQGSLQTTGRTLDLAISGDGYFVVGSAANPDTDDTLTNPAYTRAGNFYLDQDGYIVNSDGMYLFGRGGNLGDFTASPPVPSSVADTTGRMQVPTDAQSFSIGADGTIRYIDKDGNLQVSGQLIMAKFSNPEGLDKIGNNLYVQSANSGQITTAMNADYADPTAGANAYYTIAQANGAGDIVPGTLEMSNVDLSEEFTEMIVAQRGFQANTRIITTSDEILQELVNLKR